MADAQAKKGDKVQVNYKGTLNDGTVFDSSENSGPIEFTIGEGTLISGFEEAIIGMSPGDTKTEKIPSNEAYGPHSDELMLKVEKDSMPEGREFQVGDWLEVVFPDGRRAPVKVAGLEAASVTLDANHPLAGKDLVFELELVAIA